MGLEKRTVKIIIIVIVVLLVIGGIIGLVLGLLLPFRYVELEVWPRSDDYNYDQPLIQFRASDPGSWQPWVDKINKFLLAYETTVPEEVQPRAPCSTHRHDQRLTSPNCEQALRYWAPCTADNFYGYTSGMPCVFLRLNHIHYWVPEPYNMTMRMSLPDDMPDNIKRAMHILANEQRSQVHRLPATVHGDYVWVSCNGEFSTDMENIGPIQYIPANAPPGFPTHRLHTADRISRAARSLPDLIPPPLVAVHFQNPHRGVVINVECRIWTRDIVYDHTSRVGRARFEILVE